MPYAAHSAVLRSRCRYFSDIYELKYTKCTNSHTTPYLPFVDDSLPTELFKAVLCYIYTGEYDELLSANDRQKLDVVLDRLVILIKGRV